MIKKVFLIAHLLFLGWVSSASEKEAEKTITISDVEEIFQSIEFKELVQKAVQDALKDVAQGIKPEEEAPYTRKETSLGSNDQMTKESPDFGVEFTQHLEKKNVMSEETKKGTLRSYADTHVAEGDYVSALELLGEIPDGTAEWFEIYGSASIGDRSQSKALWAFIEAKKIYETQGNEDKANQMNAMINILTPK